jgi:hypothetical protein
LIIGDLSKKELNAGHFIVEISWGSNLSIVDFIKILRCKSEKVLIEVSGSIENFLPA